MKLIIKNSIKGSALYFYHITHPENEFLNELMSRPFIVDDSSRIDCVLYYEAGYQKYYGYYISCIDILKNNQLDILYDSIPNTAYDELEVLAIAAVTENNKEIIELLYKKGLKYDFQTHYYIKGNQIPIVRYAYREHGLELVKFIADLDIEFIKEAFDYKAYNDKVLLDYLVENNQSLYTIFLQALRHHVNTQEILDYFADKVDMTKYQDRIMGICCCKSLDIVKMLPNYGISLNLDKLFAHASECDNAELIEFCLQNGFKVGKDHLLEIITKCVSPTGFMDGPLYENVLRVLMKHDVDFSVLEFGKTMDYDLLNDLENHGFDKDAFINYCVKN